MQPLSLMSKFDTMQDKYNYGFTQMPLISMNPNFLLQRWLIIPLGGGGILINPNDTPPKLNAPVLANSKIIDILMSSVQ